MARRKPFEPKIGESDPTLEAKLKVAASIEEAESIDAPEVLTVNGHPVPVEFAHLIAREQTDQGIQEKAAQKAVNGKPKATRGVSVGRGGFDKQLDRKADAEVWDGFDPLTEAVDTVREPGMSYRFISNRVLNRRGRRGWEPANDAEGKPVVVAGMTLGKMPTERAERRNRHYQDLANDQLQNAGQQYELDQAKLIRDAKVKGMAPLRVGERVNDNHQHPGMVTEAGVHVSRGEAAA
jgi:hypothetical protein